MENKTSIKDCKIFEFDSKDIRNWKIAYYCELLLISGKVVGSSVGLVVEFRNGGTVSAVRSVLRWKRVPGVVGGVAESKSEEGSIWTRRKRKTPLLDVTILLVIVLVLVALAEDNEVARSDLATFIRQRVGLVNDGILVATVSVVDPNCPQPEHLRLTEVRGVGHWRFNGLTRKVIQGELLVESMLRRR